MNTDRPKESLRRHIIRLCLITRRPGVAMQIAVCEYDMESVSCLLVFRVLRGFSPFAVLFDARQLIDVADANVASRVQQSPVRGHPKQYFRGDFEYGIPHWIGRPLVKAGSEGERPMRRLSSLDVENAANFNPLTDKERRPGRLRLSQRDLLAE